MKPFYRRKVIASGLFAGLLASLSPGAARAGGTIFEANNNDGTIGAYTTSGATVNAALISGLRAPSGIALWGSDLFVVNGVLNGTIGEYTHLRDDGERRADLGVKHPIRHCGVGL